MTKVKGFYAWNSSWDLFMWNEWDDHLSVHLRVTSAMAQAATLGMTLHLVYHFPVAILKCLIVLYKEVCILDNKVPKILFPRKYSLRSK